MRSVSPARACCDEVTTLLAPGEAIVVVEGEVDVASVSILRRALLDASTGCHRRIVVDAALIEFIDAAGVGAILAAQRRLAQSGREITVRNPSPAVRRVLEIVGFGDLIEGASR